MALDVPAGDGRDPLGRSGRVGGVRDLLASATLCRAEQGPRFWRGQAGLGRCGLAEFPRGVFVQWVCDQFVKRGPTDPAWTAEGRVSAADHRNVMRAHFATYWGGLRGELAIEWIAKMVQQSMAAGFDAISIFGEVSPFSASAELNYLALVDFGSARNPKADPEVFLQRMAAPLLGGVDHARDYIRFARLLDGRFLDDRRKIPAALTSIYGRLGTLPPDAARRVVLAGEPVGIVCAVGTVATLPVKKATSTSS